ncbi:MAG TPA: hypothetical protein PKW18_02640 [Candidatus Sumerlaeota bacterium]|nr:hypothetical protein [Candidatus Sumerlaeota bacterium]HON50275.1 hypothetical protein [Candidatus Sumerlaeota bacterium]HPL73457.1 hypothetical protein [Candidatus Sumerlaeota bacterium]HRU54185.1 hypothetical protein [Candidatus Sumerlaeia bacterium]
MSQKGSGSRRAIAEAFALLARSGKGVNKRDDASHGSDQPAKRPAKHAHHTVPLTIGRKK